jgi:tRNA threonylcarbamoyladenosine biosynthesis protein TsaB
MSNPSSGPRGRVETPEGPVDAGPGVALGRVGTDGRHELLDVELLHEGSRHDDDLMPAIDRLCGRCGVRPPDLARVAVSIGPGGYTSLRIAVATAKMIAEATGAATIPVPSALVAAWCAPADAGPILVCLASKGASAFGTLLTGERREWAGSARVLGLVEAAAVDRLRPRAIIADRYLPEAMRRGVVIEPVFAAGSVLAIGAELPGVDPLALAPWYPREPEAVTLWQKRRG